MSKVIKLTGKGTYEFDLSEDLTIEVEPSADWEVVFTNKTNFTNCVVNINIAKEAKLQQKILLSCTYSTFLQNTIVAENGTYKGYFLDLASGKGQYKNKIRLEGIDSSSYFRSAIVAKNDDDKVVVIEAENAHPLSSSIMENYGVVKNQAKLLIEGIGKIAKGNHGSTNRQTSKIIVFDQTSLAKVNPLLLIDEYDVVASHSAAVGRINEDHLYYLCSRGLTLNDAREFITNGYLKPVVEHFSEEIQQEVQESLKRSGW